MAKNEKTSKKVAKKAGKLLGDPATPQKVRAPIASALAQAPDKPKKAAPKKKRR